MILKEGEHLRCPKCGGKRFRARGYVAQDWEMDESGEFLACLNDCYEILHEPDENNVWDCLTCGFSGEGSEFIAEDQEKQMDPVKVAECVYDISLMAQHLIEVGRIDVENSREMFSNILTWAEEFERAWMKSDGSDDYMERIEDYAEDKLVSTYVRKKRFESKMPVEDPNSLARRMIADLGNGSSENGDRWSSYFDLAMGRGEKCSLRVTVSLGEQKHLLPESEWKYILHVINDVDDADCELYYTDHLEGSELVALLKDLMEKMWKGEA